jgi:hypothetical protein
VGKLLIFSYILKHISPEMTEATETLVLIQKKSIYLREQSVLAAVMCRLGDAASEW